MPFIFEAVLSAPAYYLEGGHKVLLAIGLVGLVAVLIAWRIYLVRRKGHRSRH